MSASPMPETPPETPPNPPRKPRRIAEIRGAARLATRSGAGITRMAEGVHRSVLDTLGIPALRKPGRTWGITGLVYGSVHGGVKAVGKGVDLLLAGLEPLQDEADTAIPETPQQAAMLAALNGFMGDTLAAEHNPLATPMTLRHRGKVLDWRDPAALPQATGKVVLFIHGLCMNDLQWQRTESGREVSHGAALADELGYTPVYLRYNSGLHVSQNGRTLAALLEQLVTHWPVPVDELSIVAHSMGGLLARSAVFYAGEKGLTWPSRLKSLVFLGTPHHGAPLERAGSWVDERLSAMPHVAPFMALGRMRSAGITDLRYGHLLDVDWQGHDRFERKPDSRRPVPLPAGVACFTVAATTTAKRGVLADRLLGDGLVPLHSALGYHDDPARTLDVPKSAQWIVHGMSHMELVHNPAITWQVVDWLA